MLKWVIIWQKHPIIWGKKGNERKGNERKGNERGEGDILLKF